jgi:hypothetical protein
MTLAPLAILITVASLDLKYSQVARYFMNETSGSTLFDDVGGFHISLSGRSVA